MAVLMKHVVMRTPTRRERAWHLAANAATTFAIAVAWFVPLSAAALLYLASEGKLRSFGDAYRSWEVGVVTDPTLEEEVITGLMLLLVVLLTALTASSFGHRLSADRSWKIFYLTQAGNRPGRVRTVLRVLLPLAVFVGLSLLVGALVSVLLVASAIFVTTLATPSFRSPMDFLLGIYPVVACRVIPSKETDLDWQTAPPALEYVGLR